MLKFLALYIIMIVTIH